MQYPPKGFLPGGFTAHNGRPTYADDPKQVDQYTTYLAAAYRSELPLIAAEPLTSAVEHMIRIDVPPYTAHIAVAFLTHGRGSITLECSDDPYTSTSGSLMMGPGGPGSHRIDLADWVNFVDPFASVSADGEFRAVDVTVAASSRTVNLHWTIADFSAGMTLQVFAAKAWLIPVDDTTTLPG